MKQSILLLFVIFILFISCSDDDFIKCEFVSYNGTAEITEIVTSETPFYIKINFTPYDSTINYKYDYWPDTGQAIYLSGCTPDSAWLDQQNIEIGAIHKAKRSESTKGTCQPVVIEITDIAKCD